MKIIPATIFVFLVAATSGESPKADKEDQKAATEKNFAEIFKTLEKQKAVMEEQKGEIEELRKTDIRRRKEAEDMKREIVVIRQADAKLRNEVANQKKDNVKLRQAEVQLRRADAELRKADAKILEANEEETEKKEHKRQDDAKRQDDFEEAATKLIITQIEKYNRAHNNSEKLKKLILSEIKEYQANADRRLIGFAGGKAKWEWDRHDGSKSWGPEQAFSSSSTSRTCACCNPKRPRAPLIWYEFQSAHTPARFSFQRSGADGGCTPNTWRFVGSKDENCSPSSTWTELCGNMDDIGKMQIIAGTKKIVDGEEVGCDVPKYARQPFRCLGIRTYTNAESRPYCVCLKKVKIWETGMTPVA